jgi:hypothetical protein
MVVVEKFGFRYNEFKGLQAGHRWLIPVMLAAKKTEIRRIEVQSQPGQIVFETLSISKEALHKKGLV